jgi:DNA modification methylase
MKRSAFGTDDLTPDSGGWDGHASHRKKKRGHSALTMGASIVAHSGYVNHPNHRPGVDMDTAEKAKPLPMMGKHGNISAKYIVPPFSILDTRQDYWRKRRRWWLALGIKSELGRGEIEMPHGKLGGTADDHSDPVSQRLQEFGQSRRVEPGSKNGSMWEEIEVDSRRDQDERSNLIGAAKLPEYADFGTASVVPGTSIFDPVLTEMMVRWFCPEGGSVLDPFAGGSVRGIVSAMLGHHYTGVDLSAEQLEANRDQAREILTNGQPIPTWVHGDSRDVLRTFDGESFDLMLTCPPYYDLEVYSDDPRDISAMDTYADFLEAYRDIFKEAARTLRPGRYAVVVTSEVRDQRTGRYRGLVPDTIRALEDAGLHYYNEAILVNTAGTLPMRIEGQFGKTRKLGRMHQNVIVAVKGSPERGWSADRDTTGLDPQMSLFGGEL